MLKTRWQGIDFVIEEDHPEVDVYLYVYKNTVCVKDFLQGDIDTCKEIAYEEFAVPVDSWDQSLGCDREPDLGAEMQ